MKKYAKIINEETKACEVGLGTNSAFYQSIGMIEMDVEQAYDGSWYLFGFAPQKSLDELKQAKQDEINQARDNAEQGGFLYLGKIFDSDPISCQRIALASQTALISMQSQTEFSVEWTCQDNSKITLSAEQTVGMSVALTQWSNSCHIKATELKNLIKNATTVEELEEICWYMEQNITESEQKTTIL